MKDLNYYRQLIVKYEKTFDELSRLQLAGQERHLLGNLASRIDLCKALITSASALDAGPGKSSELEQMAIRELQGIDDLVATIYKIERLRQVAHDDERQRVGVTGRWPRKGEPE